MGTVSSNGFEACPERCSFIALGAASYAEPQHRQMWVETWGNQMWDNARDILGSPDIAVTNKSDKTTQIERMDKFIKTLLTGMPTTQTLPMQTHKKPSQLQALV